VFSAMVTKLLPTLYKPIDLAIDLTVRSARLSVPGVIESSAAAIRNPVTGLEHRARVTLPTGFEFTEADFVTGKARTTGPIDLQFDDTHAHLARIHWSTHGVVR